MCMGLSCSLCIEVTHHSFVYRVEFTKNTLVLFLCVCGEGGGIPKLCWTLFNKTNKEEVYDCRILDYQCPYLMTFPLLSLVVTNAISDCTCSSMYSVGSVVLGSLCG